MSGARILEMESNSDNLLSERIHEAVSRCEHQRSSSAEDVLPLEAFDDDSLLSHLNRDVANGTLNSSEECTVKRSLTDECVESDKDTNTCFKSPSIPDTGTTVPDSPSQTQRKQPLHTSNLNLLQLQLMALTLSAASVGSCNPDEPQETSAPASYRHSTQLSDAPSRRKKHKENERNKNRNMHAHKSKQQKSKIFIKCPKK